jgi:hypothetical protein
MKQPEVSKQTEAAGSAPELVVFSIKSDRFFSRGADESSNICLIISCRNCRGTVISNSLGC